MNTQYLPNKTVAVRASSALTVATTEYGTVALGVSPKVTSTATSTSTNNLVDTAGNFVNNAIAVGDVVKNTTTGKYALVTAVTSATQLALGADIMTSGNAYTIYPGTGYKLPGQYNKLMVELLVTATDSTAPSASDTLDVYIDTSLDGGVTFFNIAHFPQILGNGGAKNYITALAEDAAGTADIYEKGTDAAVNTTRQIGFGNNLRYRAVGVNGGTPGDMSFTFAINAYLKSA